MEILNKNTIIRFNPFKIFYNNDIPFLYVCENGGIFEIDNLMVAILNQGSKSYDEIYNSVENLCTKEKFNSLLDEMESNFIIKTKTTDKINNTINEKLNISGITLLIIQECNLRCSYCYGSNGEYMNKGQMSVKTGKKAIDYLIENSGNKKELSIVFFGGEPLLKFDMIKELVDYSKEVCLANNKNINFGITCNGTLITNEIEKFLNDNKFSITISIDGDRDTHNKNRFFSNKEGSYDILIEKTKNMRGKRPITARATISGMELDVKKTFNHLGDLDFSNIFMSPAVQMLDKNDYSILIKHFKELIVEFEKLIHNKNYKKAKSMGNVWKLVNRIYVGGKKSFFCGAGTNMIVSDIEGNLFPCHRLVGDDNYMIGNIGNGINDNYTKILKEFNVNSHEDCSECWIKSLCGGQCPQENLVMNDSPSKPYKYICEFNKALYEEVIKLYIRMSQEEKELLGLI